MNQPKSFTATKALFFASLLLAAAFAHAQVAGTVANLSGPLLAKKPDGKVKVLSVKSSVEQGDTLITEKDTYARIKFVDDSEITLKPNTQLKIESFAFDEGKPDEDSAKFDLVKGGLRAVTGLLGKRNKERFGMNTPTATIGIRGTIFVVEYVAPDSSDLAAYGASALAVASGSYTNALTISDAPATTAPLAILPMRRDADTLLAQLRPPGAPSSRAPGLYVAVDVGAIGITNAGGVAIVNAGQFGFSGARNLPPVIVPTNPGIRFTPPPVFTLSQGTQAPGSTSSNTESVACEVR